MVANDQLSIIFPHKLKFGRDCIETLPEDLLALGVKSLFIVTIEPLLPLVKKLSDKLNHVGINVAVNTDIVQEPSFKDFEEIMARATGARPDAVVGIGGGSVLDIAKLVAAQLKSKQSLKEIVGIGLIKSRQAHLICIPATSGTGSEVSPNAILIDDEDNQKKGIISPFLVPDIVYVDPLLTVSVPPAITAATGIDALCHCLEAYTNKFAHPFIDMYALEGIRLIADNIVQAVADGTDEDARTKVAMGSLLGGFCLGPVNTAGVHALSYPLGSLFHLPHGLSNALLLPYVMRFNLNASAEKFAKIARAIGIPDQETELQTAEKGIEKIEAIIAACGIPARLRDAGISAEAIPEIATDAMKITRLLKNNPKPITYEDAIEIYNNAY